MNLLHCKFGEVITKFDVGLLSSPSLQGAQWHLLSPGFWREQICVSYPERGIKLHQPACAGVLFPALLTVFLHQEDDERPKTHQDLCMVRKGLLIPGEVDAPLSRSRGA